MSPLTPNQSHASQLPANHSNSQAIVTVPKTFFAIITWENEGCENWTTQQELTIGIIDNQWMRAEDLANELLSKHDRIEESGQTMIMDKCFN